MWAGGVVRAHLISAHGGVESLGPSVDSAGDIRDREKALGAEEIGDATAATAAVAEDEEVFVAWQTLELGGDRPHGNRFGARDVADLEFVRFADVDDDGAGGIGEVQALGGDDIDFQGEFWIRHRGGSGQGWARRSQGVIGGKF